MWCLQWYQLNSAISSVIGGWWCNQAGERMTFAQSSHLSSTVICRQGKIGRDWGRAAQQEFMSSLWRFLGSWWIKAQQTEFNAKAWSAVKDISWVLHQMKQTKVSCCPQETSLWARPKGTGGKSAKEKVIFIWCFLLLSLTVHFIFRCHHSG